jgi:hypothetical protein
VCHLVPIQCVLPHILYTMCMIKYTRCCHHTNTLCNNGVCTCIMYDWNILMYIRNFVWFTITFQPTLYAHMHTCHMFGVVWMFYKSSSMRDSLRSQWPVSCQRDDLWRGQLNTWVYMYVRNTSNQSSRRTRGGGIWQEGLSKGTPTNPTVIACTYLLLYKNACPVYAAAMYSVV